MKLSVIIVNYNVEHFLEQCLQSVLVATQNIDAEVWVVDNASVDGSVKMVQEKFPSVKLIASPDNLGFSKGNNLAIKQSSGEYVLLLNPDTVVEQDTFFKCIAFMDSHADAGGLGVYMVDGKGNFLPESKRSLPTPDVAFFKIFGLSALFPKSKLFGKYHLGFLDKNKTNEVDVLSGAYMWLRKSVLDKVGLLDEDFFMYGEDIDLSYRITLGGFKNYYFPDARIIHYKGESTKKGSVNYVIVFYKAMIQFAQKHFSGQNAAAVSFLINIAVYLRAGLAILFRFIRLSYQPVLDFWMLYIGGYLITKYWEAEIRTGIHYLPEIFIFGLPAYIIVWLTSVFLSGGYDKPVNLTKIVRGLLVGTGAILIIYALLNEEYRFSRAIILLTSLWAIFSFLLSRTLLSLAKFRDYEIASSVKKRVVVAGSPEEAFRVEQLIGKSSNFIEFVGRVSPELNQHLLTSRFMEGYLGHIGQLEQIIEIYKIKELVFCGKDFPAATIIGLMSELSAKNIEFKIAPPETEFIIGSNSIDTAGDLYVVDINSVTRPENKRKKRILDLAFCVVFLPAVPVLLFSKFKMSALLSGWISVLSGQKSWVGISSSGKQKNIKPGILHPADGLKENITDEATRQRLGLLYARDYKPWNDILIIFRGIR